MKKKSILLIIIVLLSLPATLFAEDNSCDLAQYDFLTNQAIVEPIFGFFTIATYPPFSQGFKSKIRESDIKKWHEIKPELEKIANQENNERSADAFLLLACGKFIFENKTNEAVNMAKAVETKYPDATTIFSLNIRSFEICPFKLTPYLYSYFRKFLMPSPHHSVSLIKKEQIEKLMKRRFMLHFIGHPMQAVGIAKFLEYHITGDINLLREIIQNYLKSELRKNKQYDIQARQNGHYEHLDFSPGMYCRFERNEVIVAKNLLYIDKQEGLTTFERLTKAISDDGFYWWINLQLGDMFFDRQDYSKARKQFKLALKGYYNVISNETLYRVKTHSRSERINEKLKTSNWKRKLLEIKKKINKAGGNIKNSTDELQALNDIYKIKLIKPSPDEFSKEYFIEQLRRIYKKENQFSEAENRCKEIAGFTAALSNRLSKVNKDNKKDLLSQVEFITVKLIGIAAHESSIDSRKAMMSGVRDLFEINKENKNIMLDESTKNKVDGYIAQITGKGKVDNLVPHPESHLSDLDSSELLYATEFVTTEKLPIEMKRKMIRLLANNEDPILFDFLSEIVLNSEDSQMKSSAAWGLERIIRKRAKDIDENGKIILKK